MATIALTEENFNQTVKDNQIVIIDFWAEWCGPCKTYGPIFEATSEKYPDITFAKVNTDEQQALAGQFQVQSIPTTAILKEDILIFNQAGMLPEEGLADIITQVKALDMDKVRADIKAQQEAEEK